MPTDGQIKLYLNHRLGHVAGSSRLHSYFFMTSVIASWNACRCKSQYLSLVAIKTRGVGMHLRLSLKEAWSADFTKYRRRTPYIAE